MQLRFLTLILAVSIASAIGIKAAFCKVAEPKIKHHFASNSFLYIRNGKSFCYDGVSISEIDTRQMTLRPVNSIPQKFVRMGLSQDNQLWGIRKHHRILDFMILDGSKWKQYRLPKRLSLKDLTWLPIAVRSNQIVIEQDGKLYIFDGNKWSSKKCPSIEEDSGEIESRPNLNSLYPHKIAIGNKLLYLGYHAGEFGGTLIELNTKTGRTKLTNLEYPVSDMKFDRLGKLWFTTALSHGSSLNSEIFVLEAGRPKLISAVEGDIAPGQKNVPQNRYAYNKNRSKNWNFGATEIYQIIETAQGQLVFVTQDEGLFYLDKGTIKRIGKFWQRPRKVLDCAVNTDGTVYILDADGIEIAKTNFKL